MTSRAEPSSRGREVPAESRSPYWRLGRVRPPRTSFTSSPASQGKGKKQRGRPKSSSLLVLQRRTEPAWDRANEALAMDDDVVEGCEGENERDSLTVRACVRGSARHAAGAADGYGLEVPSDTSTVVGLSCLTRAAPRCVLTFSVQGGKVHETGAQTLGRSHWTGGFHRQGRTIVARVSSQTFIGTRREWSRVPRSTHRSRLIAERFEPSRCRVPVQVHVAANIWDGPFLFRFHVTYVV